MLIRNHELREAVAQLSTGNRPNQYYDNVSDWWQQLVAILLSHGHKPTFPEGPSVHNDEGRGHIHLEGTDSVVAWTWYRMPVSSRWEIVCYLT
jgi:hypothetical protein